jgi:hypothetical protein
MNVDDMRDFRGYLKQCTDAQVQGVYDKEHAAGREDYAELAVAEAERRGIELDR